MSELEKQRKAICDQIERDTTDLLERISKAAGPQGSAALLGVSIGMLKVLGDARKPHD